MKKITLFLFCAMMFLVQAQSQTSGTAGELTWNLDQEGVLTISGKDTMPAYPVGETPWYPHREFIKTIIIENGVENIADRAFVGCFNMVSVTMGDDVTSIGQSAFSSCQNLTSVVIGNNVTSIGEYAFMYCSKLTSIIIPDNVTKMETWAFYRCQGLTSVVIGNGLTSIENSVFDNCDNLSNVIMGSSITSIGINAFANCSTLYSITIPENVTNIQSSAFKDCLKLVEVYNLSNLDITERSQDNGYVAYYAFVVHTSAEEPSIITQQDGYIFSYYENKGYLLDYKGIETDLLLPKAFEYNGEKITSYSVYDYAFYRDSLLTSVTIHDSIIDIGYQSFYWCPNLISVVIGNGVTSIGGTLFFRCSNLVSVVIGDKVTDIEHDAFSQCENLISVTMGKSVKNIDQGSFSGCKSLTSVTIPDSVISIGQNAFSGCKSLTSVIFPDSVINIGHYAFKDCSALTSLTIGGNVQIIGYHAFIGCVGLENIYSHAIDPPICREEVFSNVTYTKCLLHVPAGRKRFYNEATVWTKFNITAPVNYMKVSLSVNNADYGTVEDIDSVDIYTELRLIATPNNGYIFSCWTTNGDTISAENPFTLTVTTDTALTANFIPDTFYVSLDVNDESWGSVTGGGKYAYNTETTIEALPAIGYKFRGWAGGRNIISEDSIFTFTVTENITLMANFVVDTFDVALDVNNESYGSVIGSGKYAYNSEVTIEAVPAEGYEFICWTNNGKLISENTFFTFTLTQDTSFTATFWEIEDVGIEDLNTTDFNMYPNPVKDILYIDSPHAIKKAVLYNVNGQVALQQENVTNSINLSALSQGVYILKLSTTEGEIVKKITKAKQ